MELWVWVTIAAAGVQTLRFMLQRRLRQIGLSTGGATFSRFVFAAPIAGVAAVLLLAAEGQGAPALSARFWVFAVAGGICQIVATFCTVALFSERSFAVGIAFTKTETVQVAGFSALILGEAVSAPGLVAILIGVAGLVMLSPPPAGQAGRFFGRAMVLGILAGGFFGLSAVGYRGATGALALEGALLRAVVALACVTAFQTVAMALWLTWREPGEVARVARAWRATALVGVTGVLGSAGWFTAFALQNAAYVRALGQVELIFGVLVSALVLRERVSTREVAGMAVLAVSIAMIVLVA